MSETDGTEPRTGRHGSVHASFVSLGCLVRRLPLFFSASPRTPLRVLCIVALDTLHVLRHSQPLPPTRVSELATFLDFQACTNANWDGKDVCDAEYQEIRGKLESAGLGACVERYLSQLGQLERRRPPVPGDLQRCEEVRTYREAVARLCLGMITSIALNGDRLGDDTAATDRDSDLDILFRMAMQCQIIDDVVDFGEDASAGLPSFLTASASLSQAVELTARAARSYAARHECSSGKSAFPLRVALYVVTVVTKVFVRLGAPGYGNPPKRAELHPR